MVQIWGVNQQDSTPSRSFFGGGGFEPWTSPLKKPGGASRVTRALGPEVNNTILDPILLTSLLSSEQLNCGLSLVSQAFC